MRARALWAFYLLLSLPACALATIERHVYRERTGDETTVFDWTLEATDSIRITAREPDRGFVTLCHADGSTASWHVKDPQRDIEVRRVGNRLIVAGSQGHDSYQDELELDAAPWYQAMSYSLRVWLQQDARSNTFWVLRPDTLQAIKLRAERKEVDTLMTARGALAAIRVEVRAQGLLAPFWKADYWFAVEEQRVLVRYRGVNGLPGTPETWIELIR